MDRVTIIEAYGDNFIYLYRYDGRKVFAVDPAESAAVLKVLESNDLVLTDVLITHHHFDHTGGVKDLKKKTGCRVMGGDKRIAGVDQLVEGGQVLTFGSVSVRVIATPGHTRTSVCYFAECCGDDESPAVFTGDTLFVGGCGRIFECGAETMWGSLRELAELADEALVYPGHDYTVENYEFALTVDPENEVFRRRLQEVVRAERNGVPSTMGQEKVSNIFLCAKDSRVFGELRRRKDVF